MMAACRQFGEGEINEGRRWDDTTNQLLQACERLAMRWQ